MAIANALQYEAARRLIRFHYDAKDAHAKFKVAQPIRCRLIAFSLLSDTLRYAVTLTFDLSICSVSSVTW